MSGLIGDYLADFEARLGFDAKLKRRAREEIAAHLADAAAAEIGVTPDEATRRAIVRFGPAESIAAAMIDATRPVRIRSARNIGLLLIAALFLVMRVRAMWIADGAILPVSGLDSLVMIDRLGFGTALLAAAAGWWLFRKAGLGPLLHLSLVTAAALALSIAAGAGIAAALAAAAVVSTETWLLALAAIAQIVLLGLLVSQLRLLGHYHAIGDGSSAT